MCQDGGGVVQRTQDAVTLDAAAGLAVGGGEQTLDTKRLAAVLGERADEQVGVFDAADEKDRCRVKVVGFRRGTASAPAVSDARGAEEQQQRQGVDEREGRVGVGGAGESVRGRGEEGGPRSRAGRNGEKVADCSEPPVLQGKAERNAREEKAGRAEWDGPDRMPGWTRPDRRANAPPAPIEPPSRHRGRH